MGDGVRSVTLASNRGQGASQGAVILSDWFATSPSPKPMANSARQLVASKPGNWRKVNRSLRCSQMVGEAVVGVVGFGWVEIIALSSASGNYRISLAKTPGDQTETLSFATQLRKSQEKRRFVC